MNPRLGQQFPPPPRRGQQNKSFGSSIQQRLLTYLVAPVLAVGDRTECPVLSDSPKVKGNGQAPAPLGFASRPFLLPDHPGNLGVSENTDRFLPSPITVCWD